MSRIVFLDTEFTDLLNPELLSLGLVALDGREHYAELDLTSEVGLERRRVSSDFVKDGVFDFFGMFPSSIGTPWEMGRRTGEWLLDLAGAAPGQRIEVAFDYSTDFALMEYAIRDSGIWHRVQEVVVPINIDVLTGTFVGEDAAETCFRELSRTRNLHRHHALADALALRAAYLAVKADTLSKGTK